MEPALTDGNLSSHSEWDNNDKNYRISLTNIHGVI